MNQNFLEQSANLLPNLDETKIFKVLSIDGGGIKGIYSAKIIEQFEKKFQCRIADYFDLLCGTSTGGLIALALSLRIPASEIVEFYSTKGKLIFPQLYPIRSLFRHLIWGGKHDNKALKLALQEVFGSHRLQDSYCLLCIPTFLLTEGRPWIFKFDHPEGNLGRDSTTKYVDVALATSAAPTYLPIVEIENFHNRQFIDGGVYANNPTLIGIAEAIRYFVGLGKPFQHLKVMSVASLENLPGRRIRTQKNRSIFAWKNDLIPVFAEGQSYVYDYIVNTLAQYSDCPFDYVRIPSQVLSPEQASVISLDNTLEEAMRIMLGKGEDQGLLYEKRPEVANFFKHKKNYIIR